MKKGIMSSMIIFMTIVSVIIMLSSSGSLNIKFSSVANFKYATDVKIKKFLNGFNTHDEIINENKESSVKNSTQNIGEPEIVQNKNNYGSGVSSEKQQKILNEQGKDISTKELQKSSETVKKDVVSPISSLKNNNIVVFKVSKEDIKKGISDDDKANLLSMSSKLSPIDYLKINSYLQDEDVETAIVNVISLLKTRLSRKDYVKIRVIFDKYIDIERVEKALKV